MRLRPFILVILCGVIILNVIAGYYGQAVVKDLNRIVSSSPVQWRPVTHFALSLVPMFYFIGAAALAIVAAARRIRRDDILIFITVSLLMVDVFTFAVASWGLSTPPKDIINATPQTSSTPNQRVDPSADNVFSLPMKSLIFVSPGSALGHARRQILEHRMRFLRCVPLLALLTGCSVQRGQIDFVFPPLLEVPLGEYRALLVFRDSTVLKMGGTHYILLIPAWCLAAVVLVFVSFVAWIIYRRQRP